MVNDNLPLGASTDSSAPFNESLNKDYKRFVSMSISFYTTINAPDNASPELVDYLLKEHIEQGNLPKLKDVDIDNIVILEG